MLSLSVPSYANRNKVRLTTGIRNTSTTASFYAGFIPPHGVTISARSSSTDPTSGIYVYPGDLVADLRDNKRKLESLLKALDDGLVEILWTPSVITHTPGKGTGAGNNSNNQAEAVNALVDGTTYSSGAISARANASVVTDFDGITS